MIISECFRLSRVYKQKLSTTGVLKIAFRNEFIASTPDAPITNKDYRRHVIPATT